MTKDFTDYLGKLSGNHHDLNDLITSNLDELGTFLVNLFQSRHKTDDEIALEKFIAKKKERQEQEKRVQETRNRRASGKLPPPITHPPSITKNTMPPSTLSNTNRPPAGNNNSI